jgi:c-di-GMP-related signal transduction protein
MARAIKSETSTPKKTYSQYTDAQIVKAVRKAAGMVSVAARALGCDTQTIYNRMKTSDEVRRAVDDARDDLLDRAESKLLEEIDNNNITAIIFALKTVGKKRGYVERQEHTGADGAALVPQPILITKMDMDKL